MNLVGANEIVFDGYQSMEETIAGLEAITVRSMKEYIDKYVNPEKFSLLVLGNSDNTVWMEKKLDF